MALLYPTQILWLRGDLDRLVEELERWENRLPSMHSDLRKAVALQLDLGYWSIGQLREDLGVLSVSEEHFRLMRAADVAIAQDDWTMLRETLQEDSTITTGSGWHVRLFAQAGLLAEAREALAQFEASEGGPHRDNAVLVLRGEIALAEGDTDAAISLLEAGLPLERAQASILYLPAAISLSRALLEKGEPARALRVLEETSELKSQSYVTRVHWMSAQLLLAERYRELGYEAEAREIEEELLGLLVYADPDFPLLLQLQGVRNSTIENTG